MSKKPAIQKLSADHPMILAGFIHELTVMETLGFTWSTWERQYRNNIPGKTTPTGRWYHRDQLVQWWAASVAGGQPPCQ